MAQVNLKEEMLNVIELFRGNDDNIYVRFEWMGITYTYNIKSEECKSFLRIIARDIADDDSVSFNPQITLQSEIDYVRVLGEKQPINHRICQGDNHVELALYDNKNTIIRVDENSKISYHKETDNIFVRRSSYKEQVRPKKSDKQLSALLREYINLNDEDYIIFVCLVVTMFFVNISHYAILISAELGSGKSTLAKIINELVECTENDITIMSSKPNDVQTRMSSCYIVSFDNLQKDDIKAVSDLICSSITGVTYTTRKLYTNVDEINIPLHNVCILNGIGILNQNRDLLSRSLVLQPLSLDTASRRTDTEFWDSFNKDKPEILYQLLVIVGKVIALKGTITVSSKERMADAYEYLVLSGIAMGYTQEYIESILANNRHSINALASVNENGIVAMIADYMRSRDVKSVIGSVTDIYNAITSNYNAADYGVEKFPRDASAFSRKLNKMQRELLAEHISMSNTTKKNYSQLMFTDNSSKSKSTLDLTKKKSVSGYTVHKTENKLDVSKLRAMLEEDDE